MNIGDEDDLYLNLFSTLKSITDVPSRELKRLRDISYPMELKKNTVFLKAGEKSDLIGYIVKGLLRKYYIDSNGKDFTKLFCLESGFVSSFAAFLDREESYFFIEALEDTILLVLDYDGYLELLKSHPCWNIFYYEILKMFYIIKERREGHLLLKDAENRYLQFLKDYPGLEKRVRQYHIASYIGILPVSLSRIRNKIK